MSRIEFELEEQTSAEPERRVPDMKDLGAALVPADEATLDREMLMILLAFKRFSVEQIAKQLNVSIERVRSLRSEPDVQDAILTLTSLLPRPGQIHELLMSDAERNVRWMRSLREGRVDGIQLDATDAKILAVRAKMATELLDRQVAKKVEIAPMPVRVIELTAVQKQRIERLIEQGEPMELMRSEPIEPKASPLPEIKKTVDPEPMPVKRTIMSDADFDPA